MPITASATARIFCCIFTDTFHISHTVVVFHISY
jgi:hypothetical protein